MTSTSRILVGTCAALLVAFTGGCQIQQDMARQPKNRPLSPSAFFDDGRSERTPVEHTVARGSIADDELTVPKDSNAFPLPLTPELMKRGQERYRIFCSPCHGIQGDGNGMIAMRGMKHPPPYSDAQILQETNGYLCDVVTNGFGAMLGYSAQIPPRDRWAIIAYVRALQLSRNAPISELSPEQRQKLNSGGSAQ